VQHSRVSAAGCMDMQRVYAGCFRSAVACAATSLECMVLVFVCYCFVQVTVLGSCARDCWKEECL
jgi:hypothetical protein